MPWIRNGEQRYEVSSIVGWKAYYAGGRVFTSKERTWESLPSGGILIVVLYEDRTYQRYHSESSEWKTENYIIPLNGGWRGFDYYWYNPLTDEWGIGNPPDVPEGAFVKLGLWVDNEEFKQIVNQAMNDLIWH